MGDAIQCEAEYDEDRDDQFDDDDDEESQKGGGVGDSMAYSKSFNPNPPSSGQQQPNPFAIQGESRQEDGYFQQQ